MLVPFQGPDFPIVRAETSARQSERARGVISKFIYGGYQIQQLEIRLQSARNSCQLMHMADNKTVTNDPAAAAAASRQDYRVPGEQKTVSKARPMPEGARVAIPMLVCRDATTEVGFCKAAFGADELSRRSGTDGAVVHATLRIGAAIIMLHSEFPTLASRAPKSDGSSPVVIYLYVGDVDSVIERATAAGARVLIPVANASWGDRVGRIIDPSGHVWNIATHIETF